MGWGELYTTELQQRKLWPVTEDGTPPGMTFIPGTASPAPPPGWGHLDVP